MTTKTTTENREQGIVLKNLLVEIRAIRDQLGKFLLLIPEESLKEYKNSSQIRKNYLKSVKSS